MAHGKYRKISTTGVAALTAKQRRHPDRVTVLSYLSLESQINSEGATWLDRQLLAKDSVPTRGGRFGAATVKALSQRQALLIEQGLAKRDGENIRYRRNLLRALKQRELMAVGKRLASGNRNYFCTVAGRGADRGRLPKTGSPRQRQIRSH